MRLVGATGVGTFATTGTVAAGLSLGGDDLQETLVTFDSIDDVERLDDLDLVEGYYAFDEVPVGYSILTGDQIATIADWEEVRSITPNEELEFEHDDARPDTRASDVHDGVGLETPYTGENVHVAVVDTGVDGAHADLEDAIEANWQWVGDPLAETGDLWIDAGVTNTDDVGHGTHCIGSVSADGTESDGEYAGMAPDVTITSYAANASLTVLKAVSAYDHLLAGQRAGDHEIHVASNSYGAGPGDYDPYDPLNVAMWKCYEEGVLITFSAGNDGPDDDTLGQRKQAPYALSVAATHADQSVTDFSSRGADDGNHDRQEALDNLTDYYSGVPEGDLGTFELNRPAVAAKGDDVMSTLNPVQPLWVTGDDDELWYGLLSGTSMANPVAAGCAALVIDAYVENHGTVPDPIDVINTLEATADPDAADGVEEPDGTDEYSSANAGAGYVDALAAVERAEDGDLASFDEV